MWEASDLGRGNAKVAVKIMRAVEEELVMARFYFAREAEVASNIRHPHVAAVDGAGEAAGTSFMVMEMVEGDSLRKLARSGGATPLARKVSWLQQVGEGLLALHRAGIPHRDLKPENVIIRPDRSACLVDLGIAKWLHFDLGAERDDALPFAEERATIRVGPYVPPETTAHGLYDALGDQYAWGVLAYELITGTAPTGSLPPLVGHAEVPTALAAIIDRARALDRVDRWSGMDALLDALVDHGSGRPKMGSSPPLGALSVEWEDKETDDPVEPDVGGEGGAATKPNATRASSEGRLKAAGGSSTLELPGARGEGVADAASSRKEEGEARPGLFFRFGLAAFVAACVVSVVVAAVLR